MIMLNDYRIITERLDGVFISASGGSGNTKTFVVPKHPVRSKSADSKSAFLICSFPLL